MNVKISDNHGVEVEGAPLSTKGISLGASPVNAANHLSAGMAAKVLGKKEGKSLDQAMKTLKASMDPKDLRDLVRDLRGQPPEQRAANVEAAVSLIGRGEHVNSESMERELDAQNAKRIKNAPRPGKSHKPRPA